MASLLQKILVVLALLSNILSLIFAYLNTAGLNGLYVSTNGFVDSKYFQHLSPDGIAFAIVWPIIYVTNLIGAIYLFVSIFLADEKSPVKSEPTLVPNHFLIGYILAWSCTVGWLFAFDREILELSFVLLTIAALSFYFAVAASYVRVQSQVHVLEENNKVMLWMIRIFIQNALCLPATWLTIATFIQIGDLVIYENSFGLEEAQLRGIISPADASSVILAALLAVIVAWFFLENFIIKKYCRYTFTIYPVLILGLSGLVARLRFTEDAQRNLILAAEILGVSVIAFLVRIALSIYRFHKSKRIGSSQSQIELVEKL